MVVLFASATYAWFTSVINPDVQSIELYVTAADAMMFSALQLPEFNKADDWMVNITKQEIISPTRGNQVTAFPSEMSAISSMFSSESNGIYTASYTDSGEVNGYIPILLQDNYVKFSLWVKTTRNGFLYLDRGSLVSALSAIAPTNAISSTVRIGFVPVDYDVNGIADGGVTLGESFDNAVIWEPNSLSHLDILYGGPGGNSFETTYAVKSEVPVTDPIDSDAINNAVSPQTTYDFNPNQTNVNGAGYFNLQGEPVTITSNNKIALYNMNMDTMQKFNIYIWVEGADPDTVDSVAKSYFRTYLKFGQEYDVFIGDTFIPKT